MNWISIKDRLPSESSWKRFLAYGIPSCQTCEKTKQVQFCRYYEGQFEFGEYDCTFDATHWMPLPSPPDNK
jgi:hypothetical protein